MKWRSVKDDPPPKDTKILVAWIHNYSNCASRWTVTTAFYGNYGRWDTGDGRGLYHDPSHWMPLPEPPEMTAKQKAVSDQNKAKGEKEKNKQANALIKKGKKMLESVRDDK